MRSLAAEFGMSDVGLKKVCHRHGVPTPGLGYWAKLAHGKRAKKEVLPPLKAGESATVSFEKREPKESISPPKRDIPAVEIREHLRRPHAAIAALTAALDESHLSEGRLILRGEGRRIASLTPAAKRRALRLLDALARAATQRGYEVRFGTRVERNYQGRRFFEVSDGVDVVGLGISEQAERKPHVAKPNEYFAPKFDSVANGKLTIDLHVRWGVELPRKTFADRDTKTLDQQLGHVLLAISDGFEASKKRRIEEEAANARWEQKARAERRAAAKASHQAALEKDLVGMSERWAGAERLRAFVRAVDVRYTADERFPEFEDWLSWAQTYAESIDPLNGPADRVGKVLEPRLSD